MKQVLPILALIATLAFVVSPLVTDPFSGFDADSFPIAQVDPPVQPAGYAFGIWSVIYIWLVISAVFAVYARRGEGDWARMQVPLILSLGPGAAWLWVAGESPEWAAVLIFWMLGTAIWALLAAPARDRWLAQAPVAIYAGWLTAAAHVSLGILLGGYGITSPDMAAVIALGLAVALGLGVFLRHPQAPEYAMTLVWALVGVLVANLGGSSLVQGAVLVALVVVLSTLIHLFRTGQAAQPL
ncbi:MAG: tryptophan-rich sensory protein [Rhodobacteraceae bacterium]|nr:MAG: tryptophan-rich sensory protein [Paracoccaceae bacterium]